MTKKDVVGVECMSCLKRTQNYLQEEIKGKDNKVIGLLILCNECARKEGKSII